MTIFFYWLQHCKHAMLERFFRVAFMLLITGPTLSRHFWMLQAQRYPSHSGAVWYHKKYEYKYECYEHKYEC